MQETPVQPLGQEDLLEKGTYSCLENATDKPRGCKESAWLSDFPSLSELL